MGQLTVRGVDDAVIAALKARAAANGRSMEAEHRRLLRDALVADRRAVDEFKAAAARLRARIGPALAAQAIIRDIRDGR